MESRSQQLATAQREVRELRADRKSLMQQLELARGSEEAREQELAEIQDVSGAAVPAQRTAAQHSRTCLGAYMHASVNGTCTRVLAALPPPPTPHLDERPRNPLTARLPLLLLALPAPLILAPHCRPPASRHRQWSTCCAARGPRCLWQT